MEKAPITYFFTELDAILDTRMGTLLHIDPQCTERVLKGGYLTRDRDVFPDIDRQVFKNRYSKRDQYTLRTSMLTPIVGYLNDFVRYTFEMHIKTPISKEPRIMINTYPYKLTKQEIDMIMAAIYASIGRMAIVEPVYMTYEQITPSFLKSNTSIIALYDPYEWLEVHSKNENLKRDSCPLVTMLGPLMFRNLDETIKIEEFQQALEIHARPFVDLQLLMSTAFSVDIERLKKSKTNKDTQST